MAAICPECTQGKHPNCNGQAWDNQTDTLTICECSAGACISADDLRFGPED